jgi:hypothetical protein
MAVAVNTDIGTVGPGIVAVLLAVEMWPSRIVLHVAAQQSAVTDRLEADRRTEFDAWAASGASGRPPEDPACVLHDELHIRLEDEAGTEFRVMAAQVGGDHSEWSSTVVYEPAPTGTLTLLIDSNTGRQAVRISPP